jgi:hypothetical protein
MFLETDDFIQDRQDGINRSPLKRIARSDDGRANPTDVLSGG